MRKQDISVDELVKMVERQELQLPEIQRRYVWRAPRVRDLLDSLYRGYPSGTILVWESGEPVPTRRLAIEQGSTPFEGQKLLLDGQQRLTSLAAVISGKPVKVRGRKNPIEILFNLDHHEGPPVELTDVESDHEPLLVDEDDADEASGYDEEEDTTDKSVDERISRRTFVVASRSLASRKQWISVSQVFAGATDAELLKKTGIKSLEDPRYQRYTERLARLRKVKDYPYVMHVLGRDLSYEEVTEIFVRVNSLGVKLRSSDLALAQITSRWRNYLKLAEKFQEECEKVWYNLDTGLLVRTMVVFATQQPKFAGIGTIPVPKLEVAWEEAKKGLRFAVNFLRSNCGVEDESVLSAPTLMVTLAVFARLKKEKLSRKEEADLAYWLQVANARGRYSRGSSETLLGEDLQILFRGGSPADLLEPIRRLFGRLDVAPQDLAGRPARNPLFSLAYLTCRAAGASDWKSGLGIQLKNVGKQHVIEYHHIFPKALLKEAGVDTSEINEIANLAFISSATNKWISKRQPDLYLSEVVASRGKEALAQQFIPMDPELWQLERYPDFLEARRKLLAEAMNAHLAAARRQSGRSAN